NRLPPNTTIEDVRPEDILDLRSSAQQQVGSLQDAQNHAARQRWVEHGEQGLRAGTVAVVTLAAGVGSRWTEGAGVVKALHPFTKFAGKHASFVGVTLARARRRGRE